MVGWRHGLNGHEFEQTLGVSEGQGSLACCSLWGHKDSDMNKLLNSSKRLVSGASPTVRFTEGWPLTRRHISQ